MKKIISFILTPRRLQGFTLIELLMSFGVLTILIAVLTTAFGNIIDASLDSNSASSIDQDGRYVTARLIYDMQRASEIVTPSTPGATSHTALTLKINSVDYTYSLDSNGNLQIQNASETNLLNSYNTRLDGLSFQRIGIGNSTDTVQVKFNLISKIKETTGFDTKSFQTTISLR